MTKKLTSVEVGFSDRKSRARVVLDKTISIKIDGDLLTEFDKARVAHTVKVLELKGFVTGDMARSSIIRGLIKKYIEEHLEDANN